VKRREVAARLRQHGLRMPSPLLALPCFAGLLGSVVADSADLSFTDSPELGTPWLYPGLAFFCFFFAFVDAYGIGANDVANSFSTAVASGTITHSTAIKIALFAEFLGALILGSSVTDTVKKKVMDVTLFEHDPYVLMLGMGCTSFGSGLWVLLATKFQMPVSSTHATIGGIAGVAIAAFGLRGVVWNGIGMIVASWFISPVCAGIVSATFYLTTYYTVLRYPDNAAFRRGLATLPVFSFLTFGTICAFMILKGSPSLGLDKLPYKVTIPIIFIVAIITSLVTQIFFRPWCERVIGLGENIPWYKMFVLNSVPSMVQESENLAARQTTDGEELSLVKGHDARNSEGEGIMQTGNGRNHVDRSAFDVEMNGGTEAEDGNDSNVRTGLFGLVEVTPAEEGEFDAARLVQQHDGRTESLYQVLQVATCTFASLAHGSNDIANSIGPLATVWMVFSTGQVAHKAPVPAWLLAYGALAMDIGLLTYGHHIMKALGNRLTYHSPSRGFSMDLGAMFTVLVFSKLGVPVSTTHCKCGSTAAVGCSGGDVRAVNWKMVAIIFFGWIITLPCAGFMSGCLFYLIASAPQPMKGNGFFDDSSLTR